MKFVSCSESLPEHAKNKWDISNKCIIRNAETKSLIPNDTFRSYAGINEVWALSKFEWLDESIQSFSLDDMSKSFFATWTKEVSFQDFMKEQYNIDIP